MKYLLVLILLAATACTERGKEYEKFESRCLLSHSEPYTCMRYSNTLEMYMPATCYRTVCDKRECYNVKYRSNGWFRFPTELKRKVVSCK